MPDIAAISGALSALKASTDLTKAMLGLRDANLVREKALELTTQIFSARESALEAQTAQTALLKEIGELKAQIKQFEDWEAEKQRYVLTELPTGTFAYATKDGEESSEPAHKICASCFQSRRKSILQPHGQWNSYERVQYLHCPVCNTDIVERSPSTERVTQRPPRKDLA